MASTCIVPTLSTGSSNEGVLIRLLDQPNELIGEVVRWLDVKDLLNLRTVSKRLHELVHDCEEAACARYCQRLRRRHSAFQLPGQVFGHTNDLFHYVELQQRFEAICQLSLTLSNHISGKIKVRSRFEEKLDEKVWRIQKASKLHRELFPALFAFDGFLATLREIFVRGENDLSCFDDDIIASMHDTFELDQQRLIEDMRPGDEESIASMSAAFAIFIGVGLAKKLTLNYKTGKFPFPSIKKVMIYRGLSVFRTTFAQSREDARSSLGREGQLVRLGGGRKPFNMFGNALPSIYHIDTDRSRLQESPDVKRSKTRNSFVENQCIWSKAAFAVLQRKGLTQDFPPDTDEWIKKAMVEQDDPVFDIGNWSKPDP